MRIFIRDTTQSPEKHYRADVTLTWAQRHDNGALISCGLAVPDNLSCRSLAYLLRTHRAVEVSHDAWNHSGCLSRCKLRGDSICHW